MRGITFESPLFALAAATQFCRYALYVAMDLEGNFDDDTFNICDASSPCAPLQYGAFGDCCLEGDALDSVDKVCRQYRLEGLTTV